MGYLSPEQLIEIDFQFADLMDEIHELRAALDAAEKRADEAERQVRMFRTQYPEAP